MIKRLKTSSLHLIMDRPDNVGIGPQEFQNLLADGKKLEYKNIWKLDDNYFVAKGFAFYSASKQRDNFFNRAHFGILALA